MSKRNKITWTDEATGKTMVSREKRRTPRKTIVAVVAGGLALTAGVAWAIYVMTAGVDGQLVSKSLSYQWTQQQATTGNGGVIKSNPTMTCSAVASANGATLTVDVQGWPGDSCIVRKQISLTTPSGVQAVLVGFNTGTLPTGWKMTVNPGSDCGTAFNTTTNAMVGFKVTVGDGGTGGVAIPANSAFQFAPSDQDTGALVNACNAAANANQ